jgi:hypothetical protein
MVPASLGWLAPIAVEGLVRVGGPSDGGYVIPETLLREADVLISMGLGHNWQFEKDARVLNPAMRVHVYDHTVSEKLFNREYLAEVAALLTGRVGRANVERRRVRDYRAWFGKEATHFRERIHDQPDSESVDIATVFATEPPLRFNSRRDIAEDPRSTDAQLASRIGQESQLEGHSPGALLMVRFVNVNSISHPSCYRLQCRTAHRCKKP